LKTVQPSAHHAKMPPIQDIHNLRPKPENALFLNQLESLMMGEFVGDDVPAACFLDELEAMIKHEFFADPPRAEGTGPITQIIGQLIESFTPESDGIRFPLCYLLMMFRKSEASNLRDRLFAFLGLAADGNDSSLRPNYNESVESVFLRYAKYFVRSGDGMKLL
jgi:hypothetical protein